MVTGATALPCTGAPATGTRQTAAASAASLAASASSSGLARWRYASIRACQLAACSEGSEGGVAEPRVASRWGAASTLAQEPRKTSERRAAVGINERGIRAESLSGWARASKSGSPHHAPAHHPEQRDGGEDDHEARDAHRGSG